MACGGVIRRPWGRNRVSPGAGIGVLVLGLDGAGKTQVCCTLAGEEHDGTRTMGMRAPAHVRLGKAAAVRLTDVGGSASFRPIWPEYLPDTHAIVFVVDGSSQARLHEARDALAAVVSRPTGSGKPLLVLVNERDAAAPVADVQAALRMEFLDAHARAQPCCAMPSAKDGRPDRRLLEGLRWLHGRVCAELTALNERILRDQERHRGQEAEKRAVRREKARAAREARSADQERVNSQAGNSSDAARPIASGAEQSSADGACAATCVAASGAGHLDEAIGPQLTASTHGSARDGGGAHAAVTDGREQRSGLADHEGIHGSPGCGEHAAEGQGADASEQAPPARAEAAWPPRSKLPRVMPGRLRLALQKLVRLCTPRHEQ